jgi:hypothetical protein
VIRRNSGDAAALQMRPINAVGEHVEIVVAPSPDGRESEARLRISSLIDFRRATIVRAATTRAATKDNVYLAERR